MRCGDSHLTINDKKGILLEKALHFALLRLGFTSNPNPFNDAYRSKQGKGLDNSTITRNGELVLFECKNLAEHVYMSRKFVKKQILNYFMKQPYGIKILVVSHANMSNEMRNLCNYILTSQLEHQMLPRPLASAHLPESSRPSSSDPPLT